MVAAASVGGIDPRSGACAAVAVVLLGVSTVLLLRWPDGPTTFLTAAVLQCAVVPRPTIAQLVAVVVAVTAYLVVADAAQSGRGSTDRRFWLPQLRPLAAGAVIGVVLTVASMARPTASAYLLAAAGVAAGTAGVGVLLLADRARRLR